MMANLFWKSKEGVKTLLATPFRTEDDFERMVFDTRELLEDVFLLKRQVRGGNKQGIPDIVGIDSDGNICIIEMKNCTVDSSIIPQVLKYAFWAETNPDSVKTLWLECDDRPDDMNITWERPQVRILIIAPSVRRSTLDLIDKINYPVDLIEVRRWVDGDNEILFVNKLETENQKPPRLVSSYTDYDEEFYKTLYNNKSVVYFLKYSRELNEYVQKKGWDLEIKFNKHYCCFKAGFFNAFGIKWIGSKTFALFFKLPKESAESTHIPMTRYEEQWKEAIYYVEPGKTKITTFGPLFEMAYKRLSGD